MFTIGEIDEHRIKSEKRESPNKNHEQRRFIEEKYVKKDTNLCHQSEWIFV